MKRIAVMAGVGLALVAGHLWWAQAQVATPAPAASGAAAAGVEAPGRFVAVDVTLGVGGDRLAAYQLELVATNATVKIVGVEGGEPAVFRPAPHYDPSALQGGRVVLGAFTTAPRADLPEGRLRVARVHCLVGSGARVGFGTRQVVAASASGQPLTAQVFLEEASQPRGE